MGTRPLIHQHIEKKEDGKDWSRYELGRYEYITWKELGKRAREVGSAFRALGLGTGERIGVFAATS